MVVVVVVALDDEAALTDGAPHFCWLNRFSGSPSGLDDETASALRGVGSSAQLRAQSSSSLQFSSKLRATPWLVSLLATSPPPTWPPHHHRQDKKHDLISSYIIV